MHRLDRYFVTVLLLVLVAPSAAIAQGLSSPKDIFRANLEATGGESAWDAVHTMHTSGEMVMALDMGTMSMNNDTWIIRPDHLLTKISVIEAPEGVPAGDNTIYITPDGGWIDGMQGRQNINDLPPNVRSSFDAGMYGKEELALLERADEDFTLLDPRDVEGSMAYVVEVKGDVTTRRFYDQESLLLVATETPSPMGGMAMTYPGDYQETSGLLIPRSTESDIGMGTMTMTVKAVEINNPDLTPAKLAEMAGN